jgi:hypothetical protein
MANYMLDIDVRLGELLAAIPNKKASSGEGTRSLPPGVSKAVSHQAQTLAANLPDDISKHPWEKS